MYFRSGWKSAAKVHEYTYMRRLLEGSVYFLQLLIQGRHLLEGGVYWRATFIGINTVCVSSLRQKNSKTDPLDSP